MAKIPVDFGEWRPDIALLDTKFASEVDNVFAGVNSYLPFPSLLPFSATGLAGTVCGLYAARTSGGEWKIFAGTPTKLYSWALAGWTDVSRTAGGGYNVSDGDLWMFEQSGTKLVAVNFNDNPQVIDIDVGTNFADLAGSPPRATNVKQTRRLSVSVRPSQPASVRSSGRRSMILPDGLSAPTLRRCRSFQTMARCRASPAAKSAMLCRTAASERSNSCPATPPIIFNFSRVLHDRGCISKYGFTSIGNNLYFVSEDGFYAVTGQQVGAIGADKVNDWWLANSDTERRNVIVALAGVNKPRVVWVFHSSSASPMYDRQIIFDWSNQRWARASISAQVWALAGLARA